MPRDIEKGIDLPSRTGAVDRDSIDLSAFPVEPWEWDDANEVSEPDLTLVDPWSLVLEKNLTLSGNLSFGAQYPGVNSVTDDDYTVTDSDGYSVILVSAGASDRTVDLPTAGDNTHRLITVVKVDSGAGKVTVDGESGENIQIDQRSNNSVDLLGEDCRITVISDGSNWITLESMGVESDVANTVPVVGEHIFTADNELDYTSDIADATTVTVSELPSNTVAMYIFYKVTRAGTAYISYKRSSGDTFLEIIDYSSDNDDSDARAFAWILTDGNSFYVGNEKDTCEEFYILGYKTKGS